MTEQGLSAPGGGETSADHRARRYERPDFPFRCGREGLWSLACGRGPNADGSCGGVTECLPTRKGDRWHCSRPASAGGACDHGPKPDGSCYINRPPCRPKSSMRARRRHASVFALLVSLSVIAAFFATSSGLLGFDRNLAIPGPLTAAHANLIDGDRCDLCHAAHQRDGLSLVAAIVEHQDLSAQCIDCHDFGGRAFLPHSSASMQLTGKPGHPADHDKRLSQICWDGEAGRLDPDDKHASGAACKEALGCIGCHTEHQGADADIARLRDGDCHQCHRSTAVFEDFLGRDGRPHPPFGEGYGRLGSSAISFDHDKHLEVHFNKAGYEERRPDSCLACHEAKDNRGEIAVPGFETGCAGCHEEDITDQPLHLLTWPELENMESPSAAITEACAVTAEIDPDDFEATSYELPGVIDSFLLAIDLDDMERYGEAYQRLARLLVLEGVQPLADLVSSHDGEAAKMLAGLSPETVSLAACSWLSNLEYEGFPGADGGGWKAEPLSLSYHPTGHADPILKAWIEFASSLHADEGERAQIDAMQSSLFDPESAPGNCAACHDIDAEKSPRWTSSATNKAHTSFAHKPHLALAKAKGGDLCKDCHRLEQTVADPDVTGFATIGLETCQSCHGNAGVDAGCATCHDYHP